MSSYPSSQCDHRSSSPLSSQAFEIITSNALRVAAINSVGDFVLFLGKVGAMCLCGVFAVLWLRVGFLFVPRLISTSLMFERGFILYF